MTRWDSKKKRIENNKNYQKTFNKMAISIYLSIITVNVNDLYVPRLNGNIYSGWMDF